MNRHEGLVRTVCRGLAAAAVLAALASCGTESQYPSTGGCSGATPPVLGTGAPKSLGFAAGQGTLPVWSSAIGSDTVIDGQSIVSDYSDGCVVAVAAASGKQLWSWADDRDSPVMGVTAAGGTVVVATGTWQGKAPAAVFATVTDLIALDAATGREKWSRPLPEDGQGIPAVVSGDDVVVTEADGTLLGLDAAGGAVRWTDRPPAACKGETPESGDLSRDVEFLAGSRPATITYQCSNFTELAEVDPASGALTWSAPNWGASTMNPVAFASGVLAVAESVSGPVASDHFTASLVPAEDSTESVVALDQATGRALWEMDGVPVSTGIFAGGGQICAASEFGIQCANARTGAPGWRWIPSAVPADGGSAWFPGGIVADSGLLYLTAPTPKAGDYQLDVMDMATGKIVDTKPLPSYSGGSEVIAVGTTSPPGVLAVGDGMVFASPQIHEANVVEAFPLG